MPQIPGVPDHAAPEQPQPVVDAAKIGGLVQAAVTTVGGLVFLIVAGVNAESIGAVGIAAGAAVTALVALVVYVVGLWHARKAAAVVTPLSSPRDASGRPLVPLDPKETR